MRAHKPLTVALGLAALTACQDINLSSEWQLDRTRVLATQATPAEPQPGQLVSFDALTYAPDQAELGVLWYVCLETAFFLSECELDAELEAEFRALDPESLSPEELEEWQLRGLEAGILGRLPGWDPVVFLPPELLEILEEPALAEGLSMAIHVDAWSLADPDGDVERAYTYMPVSLATTPNNNPQLAGLLIDGELLEEGAVFEASAGQGYNLEASPVTDSIETYTYVTTDGVEESREEEPEYRWYAVDGELGFNFGSPDAEQDVNLFADDGNITTGWTAPEAGEGVLVLIMKDQRGGTDWLELPYVVQ